MQSISYNRYFLKKHQLLMATPDLPTSFDLVVIGTGLEESLLAAAASRSGRSVLHLDTNNYYGNEWAAFHFQGLRDWADRHAPDSDSYCQHEHPSDSVEFSEALQPGQKFIPFGRIPVAVDVSKTKQRWFNDNHPEWPEEKLRQMSSRFSLDLMPRLLYARGRIVELLIKSNVSRYTEFMAVNRILTLIDGHLEPVPSSRADVFASKQVSVLEKRLFMKFVRLVLDGSKEDESHLDQFKDLSFEHFLRHEKLTDNLIHFVLNCIAMVEPDVSFAEGWKKTRHFLQSLGRFNNATPFLWSVYGSGELSQAFCRLCAVFGGTYYLGRSVEGLVVEDHESGRVQVVAVVCGRQQIQCKQVVISAALMPENLVGQHVKPSVSVIERKIVLLSESVLQPDTTWTEGPSHGQEPLTLISLPPQHTHDNGFAFAIEVGSSGAVCPKGLFCLHLTVKNKAAEEGQLSILDDCLDALLGGEKGHKMLWSLDFTLTSKQFTPDQHDSFALSNLFVCNGPCFELDMDSAVENASTLFAKMFGAEEEFLPRAPDPEEIIIGGNDEAEAGEEQPATSPDSLP